mmetsp:Transcript_99796/g.197998  ORF Transcript_99796/g.197998 Transcript_99796/m.197998 type:complete len:251 (+) Transcript_99796:291-1043(+)
MTANAFVAEPNSWSVHILKFRRYSCSDKSISASVMYPERSESNARHAPRRSPRKWSLRHAAVNSTKLQRLELSLSSRCRHAFKWLPNLSTNISFNSFMACEFGWARSMGCGRHLSRNFMSSSVMNLLSSLSSPRKSSFSSTWLLCHPRRSSAFPKSERRTCFRLALSMAMNAAEALPNPSVMNLWKLAMSSALFKSSLSRVTLALPSTSSVCQMSVEFVCHPSFAQAFINWFLFSAAESFGFIATRQARR